MEEPVVEVVAVPDADLVVEVGALAADVAAAVDVAGLSEARLRALARTVAGAGDPVLAVTARHASDRHLVGYAQIDDEGDHQVANAECALAPDTGPGPSPVGGTDGPLADRLLGAALAAFGAQGGGRLRMWVSRPGPADDARAVAHGLRPERDLLQLRCPLPLPAPARPDEVVPTRAFRVGRDEAAWITTNNRAFAGHPEQGSWDLATLAAREAEPWFDPEGFRVHEVGGRLAASCWTKVHADAHPVLGEIYVISVDPDFHGRGLGRALTRAGLEWLAGVGVTTGMLYVDGANGPALHLYRSMGFTTHHLDRAYVGEVGATTA